MRYRRAKTPGETYIFTINLADRRSDALLGHIDDLRTAVHIGKTRYPYRHRGDVVLHVHLHAIWRLSEGDADYPLCWSLIEAGYS